MTDTSYEQLYHVGLLDDLHNFFPAVLYEPERFHSVQELLTYISSQTRDRFNLFNRGMNRYQNTNSTINTPAQTAARASIPVSQTTTIPPTIPQRSNRTYSMMFPQLDIVTETIDLAPFLSSAMINTTSARYDPTNIIRELLNLNRQMRTNAMEPVIVAPSEQQLSSATTVAEITDVNSLRDQICSVCQEGYTANQITRKINFCNHMFHKDCIDPWFGSHVHCPVCRHDIRETQPNNIS
jgi:hypothetical protein